MLSDHAVLARLDCARKFALQFSAVRKMATLPVVCWRIGLSWGSTIMAIEDLIIWLVIGAIAGWLAGLIVKGYGLGLIGNIVVGIIGAFIAGWLLPRIGFVLVGGILAAIVNAVIGAVILLLVIGLLNRPS
jgi:uncharacterized membrane protein YeaQ/YmgE (transglycosylase-associated protein family)